MDPMGNALKIAITPMCLSRIKPQTMKSDIFRRLFLGEFVQVGEVIRLQRGSDDFVSVEISPTYLESQGTPYF